MRRALVSSFCVLALLAAVGLAQADEPTGVDVTPSTGLAGGDVVHVAAADLPPGVTVEVIQCDVLEFIEDLGLSCGSTTFVTIGDDGALSFDYTLSDPIYRYRSEFGDPDPVYCRADICRIYVAWDIDPATESAQVISSAPLEFTGSPATVEVTPSTELRKKQKVRIDGTAYGAEGQAVDVFEEACFSIIQGSGCYGTSQIGSAIVGADGTWTMGARVSRFLADGTDCSDTYNILGACEVSPTILTASGTPDDSFGVSRRGQPAAWLTFRTRGHGH